MSHPKPPPVRACLFDMDGLLLNTEDIYTLITNTLLTSLDRPKLPWSVKARLQGRPAVQATEIFAEWAKLPIPLHEYKSREAILQREHFPTCSPLPGVAELLSTLTKASAADGGPVHMALATSSTATNYKLKTAHQEEVMAVFPEECRVKGDDPRITKGRGKPCPDIYLLALETINERLRREGNQEVKPEECLVFEDAVPGVESGRRAGMQVVWVPHPDLLKEYGGREAEVLAGACKEAEEHEGNGKIGKLGDGWAELRDSLVGFDYERYGIRTDGPVKN